MTGRYVRKSVPLEVRGISRDRPEDPFPQSHPAPLSSSYNYDTVSSYISGEGAYTSSGESTPSHELESWIGLSYGGVVHGPATATGNTTDRSSIFSMGEDEFDRQASRQVRRLFDNIEAMMFERNAEPVNLRGECDDWVLGRPHLRILGKQMVSPQDPGYQVITSPRGLLAGQNQLTDVTEQDISLSHAMNELSVSGRQLDVQLPGDMMQACFPVSEETMYLQEEIFEQDGCFEDIIAVDYYPSEEDQRSVHRIRRGMPPLTPQACVRDNIVGSVFDIVWTEALSWLRLLLEHYSLNIIGEVDEGHVSVNHDRNTSQDGFPLDPHMALFAQSSHESSLLNSSRPQDKARMTGGLHPLGGTHLETVLTISSKALLPRERSTLIAEEQLESALSHNLPFARPASSLVRVHGRPNSVKLSEQRMASARVKGGARGRLAPLERAKTPNTNEDKSHVMSNEVLKGHRLTTLHDIPSQPFSRNGALPPIALMDTPASESPRPGLSKNNQRKQGSLRASSAVHDKDNRLPLREKILLNSVGVTTQDGRPSTTHALYRSETPQAMGRRSSTPLGYSKLGLTHGHTTLGLSSSATGGVMRENLVLNVTGNSINPHGEGHASPADGDELDEADDALDDLSHHAPAHRWGNHHIHPQVRRAKHQAAVR